MTRQHIRIYIPDYFIQAPIIANYRPSNSTIFLGCCTYKLTPTTSLIALHSDTPLHYNILYIQSKMTTDLSTWYPWISHPLICNAPMRNTAGPELAVTVSRTGGLGFIGPSNNPAGDLQEASDLLSKSPSTPLSSQRTLPIGIGFLLWEGNLDGIASAVQTYKPAAAWLYAPREKRDLYLWTEKIRSVSPETKVWVQIGTVSEAKEILAEKVRPDVAVIQGAEAGGHGRAVDGMGLMTLFPEIADVLRGSGIPLLAAGGIADGRGAAAAFCLGASGVVMGTRFLACPQARGVPKGYQNEIVNSAEGATSTTRTLLYNHLQGVYGWPEPFSPRVVTNRTWDEHRAGVEFEQLKKRYDEAKKDGDSGYGPGGRLVVYAGAGVGLIGEVKDAVRIVADTRDEVVNLLSGSLLGNKL